MAIFGRNDNKKSAAAIKNAQQLSPTAHKSKAKLYSHPRYILMVNLKALSIRTM